MKKMILTLCLFSLVLVQNAYSSEHGEFYGFYSDYTEGNSDPLNLVGGIATIAGGAAVSVHGVLGVIAGGGATALTGPVIMITGGPIISVFGIAVLANKFRKIEDLQSDYDKLNSTGIMPEELKTALLAVQDSLKSEVKINISLEELSQIIEAGIVL